MKKLVRGLHAFQANIFSTQRELFERLAEGQNPEALFITCSDSRINPNLITQTKGDIVMSTATETQGLGLKDAPPAAPPITVTEKAAAEVKKHIADHQASGSVEAARLRVEQDLVGRRRGRPAGAGRHSAPRFPPAPADHPIPGEVHRGDRSPVPSSRACP